MEIIVSNVNQALSECLHWLDTAGLAEASRNGPVIVSPEPVIVTYLNPTERVLFSPLRDANPFFHLMEALWMLAGRDNIDWPVHFNKRMIEFSDDGVTQWGAYGYRWRHWFGYDQLRYIVDELTRNPNSRRCVLAMWDGRLDLQRAMGCQALDQKPGRDVPCNTQAYFDRRDGALNMTVCNRSNDLLWGLAGANAVHFSVLQEYLAHWIGCPTGVYRQFTNNLHMYTDVLPRHEFKRYASDASASDLYLAGVRHNPLVSYNISAWDDDLRRFFANPLTPARDYSDPFFSGVACNMYAAWHARRARRESGMGEASAISAADWRMACVDWITRRMGRSLTETAASA